MRRRNEVSLLVQHEDNGRNQRGLRVAEKGSKTIEIHDTTYSTSLYYQRFACLSRVKKRVYCLWLKLGLKMLPLVVRQGPACIKVT